MIPANLHFDFDQEMDTVVRPRLVLFCSSTICLVKD